MQVFFEILFISGLFSSKDVQSTHSKVTWINFFNIWLRCYFDWRRKWQPTPVLLPGKFHRQRSLVGYMGPQSRTQLSNFTFFFFDSKWLELPSIISMVEIKTQLNTTETRLWIICFVIINMLSVPSLNSVREDSYLSHLTAVLPGPRLMPCTQ